MKQEAPQTEIPMLFVFEEFQVFCWNSQAGMDEVELNKDLVIHADPDWEVDHIVVGVSEGLQNVFFGDKKRKSVLCSCIKLLCLVLFTFF